MSDKQLELLERIAKDVADIKLAMAASVGASASALGVSASSGGGSAPGGVATASELDGEYGDPVIRHDPKRWTGDSFVGSRFSETSPEYLDCVAEFKEWQAGKDEAAGAKDGKGRPKANWGRKDARLARGWAARMRSGWKPATGGGGVGGGRPVTDEDYGDDAGDDIPFAINATLFGRRDRP